MSENKETVQNQEQQPEQKPDAVQPAKRGKAERAGYVQQPVITEVGDATITATLTQTALSTPPETETIAEINSTTKPKDSHPTISDAQLKAYFEKAGIEYNGIDELKKKLSGQKEPVQESDDQKAEREKAYEKRMLDVFTSGTGTVDQYAAIKNLANSDVKELSRNEIKRELTEAGFKDEEIDTLIREMYLQVDDEELEQYDDETEKEFLKRKRDFGSKILENRALSIKQSAEGILNGLKSAVEAEDLQKQEEEQLSSKIDEHFSAMPRIITFELGTENNRKIDPIEYEVSEKDLAEIRETLKDPAQRNNYLFNEEGNLNLDNLATVMLHNKVLRSALKTAYLTGETKSTEQFNSTFGARTAYGVGVGGVQQKIPQKGAATQVGKPQRVMPSQI